MSHVGTVVHRRPPVQDKCEHRLNVKVISLYGVVLFTSLWPNASKPSPGYLNTVERILIALNFIVATLC